MELDVKAVMPAASGWKYHGDKTYVTDWNVNILLWKDIWETVRRDGSSAYYKAPLKGGTLYLDQDVDSGYSTFYLSNPENHHGFGGREIELDMHNGDTVVLKGPWSSNSGVVNEAIFEEAFEPIGAEAPCFEYVKEVTFYSNDWRSVGLAANLAVPNLTLLVQEYLGTQWHLAWGALGDSGRYVRLHAPEPTSCPGSRIL